MPFTLLPAVDVAGGRAVRPVSGVVGGTLGDDPRVAALAWQSDGAAWIHLVDLDAAFGRGSNADLVGAIIGELDVEVELSGGIRDDLSLMQALATGCSRVVLSTAALDDAAWCARVIAQHGERIAVALDVRVVARPDGSEHQRLEARDSRRAGRDLWETLEFLDGAGCARYVVTDVGQDGMLRGPNAELGCGVADASCASVISSGGISTLADLVTLTEVAATRPNFEGTIVGTALSAGRFTLREALAAVAPA